MTKHGYNRLKVDLPALVHNLKEVRRLAGPGTRIMGIVKADAYGHGQVPVSRILVKNGVDCLGVAFVHEALDLRQKGIGCSVVVLCGIQTREEAAAVVENNLTPVVYDLNAVEMLARESEMRGKHTCVHIKVDTGMGRLGLSCPDIPAFVGRIKTFGSIYVEGLTSHLSSADEPARDFTLHQIETFASTIETVRAMGLELPFNNLPNSAGIMGFGNAHLEMARPGIMLYGGLPSPECGRMASLRPVMHFIGRILQVRCLPDQTPVSYGRSYYTDGPKRIAVLSAGYADGIPRKLSNRGKVLIRGRKFPIVGRVCMNMLMCDVTAIENIGPGETVVFLGTQGEETITGEEMAGWAETISYEVFCNIGRSHDKEYVL
ncbi:MAG: alanine racemase [Desulfatiglandales bacterium]